METDESMHERAHLTEHHKVIPGFFVQAVWSAAAEQGIELADTSLPRRISLRSEQAASAAITWADFRKLLHALEAASKGDPTLAIRLGLAISEPNLHLSGLVITASRTLREAIQTLHAIQRHRTGVVRWELRESGPNAHFVQVTPRPDFEAKLTIALAFGLTQRFFGERHSGSLVAHLTTPVPADPAPYQELLGHNVRFAARLGAISFASSLLDRVRPGTDPSLARLLRQVAIERSEPAADHTATWAARVEAALRSYGNLASVDTKELAERWQLTPRTLRHFLQREGQTLTNILNRVRFERAQKLLASSEASITHVSEALGYSDTSSFKRAFKRWSGHTVQGYREGR